MRQYNLSINGTSYEVVIREVTEEDVTAEVNGQEYVVQIQDIQDLSKSVSVTPFQSPNPAASAPSAQENVPKAPAASPSSAASSGNSGVCSPMPGQIIKIFVAPGEKVLAGQKLMVLEAMKLENTITASREGTVKAVLVKEGDIVNQGQSLLELN